MHSAINYRCRCRCIIHLINLMWIPNRPNSLLNEFKSVWVGECAMCRFLFAFCIKPCDEYMETSPAFTNPLPTSFMLLIYGFVKSYNKLNIAIYKSQTQWRRRVPFKSSSRAPSANFWFGYSKCVFQANKIDNTISHQTAQPMHLVHKTTWVVESKMLLSLLRPAFYFSYLSNRQRARIFACIRK